MTAASHTDPIANACEANGTNGKVLAGCSPLHKGNASDWRNCRTLLPAAHIGRIHPVENAAIKNPRISLHLSTCRPIRIRRLPERVEHPRTEIIKQTDSREQNKTIGCLTRPKVSGLNRTIASTHWIKEVYLLRILETQGMQRIRLVNHPSSSSWQYHRNSILKLSGSDLRARILSSPSRR